MHSILGGASDEQETRFGLSGLLDVLRMSDNRDLQGLALGSDLLTFGLNLNSQESLFASFSNPFADQPQTAEPQFTVPTCYVMPPPPLRG
jgi:CCR4-NOT transcription complex subunit 2